MYYSTTQVCRCNEETRTNSSETSLIGQPIFDTETNTLYIGDGETKIKELQPITNLNAGIGMTINGGSVSLNQGTQTNAGGIKIWGDGKDIWYNENNSVSLMPIRRQSYNIPSYHYPNYSISGVATNRIDGERKTIEETTYIDFIGGEFQETSLGGEINCNKIVYTEYNNSDKYYYGNAFNESNLNNGYFQAYLATGLQTSPENVTILSNGAVFSDYASDRKWKVTGTEARVTGSSMGSSAIIIGVHFTYETIPDPEEYSQIFVTAYANYGVPSGYLTGSQSMRYPGCEVISVSNLNFSIDGGAISGGVSGDYQILTNNTTNDTVKITATAWSSSPVTIDYDCRVNRRFLDPTFYYKREQYLTLPSGYTNLSFSPIYPSGLIVEKIGEKEEENGYVDVRLNVAYNSKTNLGHNSIEVKFQASYNTSLYTYTGTNSSRVTGSYYRTTPTSSSTTVINSGVSGGYAYATLATPEKGKTVSANVTTTYTTWNNGYNYYYSVNYNGSTRSCTNIEVDNINYRANSTKYNEYLEWARNNP